MTAEFKENVSLAGVLAILADAKAVMAEVALADENIHQLCGIVDEDGPDVEREGATLALAALLAGNERLKRRIDAWIEDARAYGAYSSMKGATVYECHCIRNLLLAVVALWDAEAAARIAEEREIHWPDPGLWPAGLPQTPADAFATLAREADEERVAALGQSWLDGGIVPESLAENLGPMFKALVGFRKEPLSDVRRFGHV